MAAGQLAGRCSLRDIVSNLSALKPQAVPPGHRTGGPLVAGAGERGAAAHTLRGTVRAAARALPDGGAGARFLRFRNPLRSLDSTTIDLCPSAFPRAKLRRAKGAIKPRVGLEHGGCLPAFVRVTEGSTADIEAARTLRLPAGSIISGGSGVPGLRLDRLLDFARGVPGDADEAEGPVRGGGAARGGPLAGAASDRTIEFTSAKGRKRRPHRLRRIGCRDSETGRRYVFPTTDFALSAKTVAEIYKSRWQVDLFFKWIKQNPRSRASSAPRATP